MLTDSFVVFFFFVSLDLHVRAASERLVWSDEFQGSSINLTNWRLDTHCGCELLLLPYILRIPFQALRAYLYPDCLVYNSELECYTANPRNARLEDGYLVIRVVPENYQGWNYTSARLVNQHTLGWLGGRFESRARLPRGSFLWPALWLTPRDPNYYGPWASSGEIDIMEARGQEPNITMATLHYGGARPHQAQSGSGEVNMQMDLSRDFHNYSLTWTADLMSFHVDSRQIFTQNLNQSFWSGSGVNPYSRNGQPFDREFHWILNVAVGGSFFPWSKYGHLTPTVATHWEKPTFEIDYVRVYQ